MDEKVEIKQEFLEQAKFIARGTEVLPGGVSELALKLQKSKETGVPLRIKLGMDPTRPDLHLGHTVVMKKLAQFQKLGHKIVLLVGGATAMIGDPSGKSDTRPALTKEQVEFNAKTYFEQMARVVDISNAEVVNNADWLCDMRLMDLLKLASTVTVAQMMTRDDFAKRMEMAKPIAIHEFFYPLLQAYDSVHIKADIELGGTDQRFNVLLGRDVQQSYGNNDPQMVMLLPLLEGTDGVIKMSKSYPEHCISINEEPKDMYGKLMSIPDNLIIRYYTLLTDTPDEEIKQIEERLKNENPRNIKMQLAYTITKQYNGQDAADFAQNEFVNVIQNKGIPQDIPEYKLIHNIGILDLLLELNFVASKGDAKRLIQQGAVKSDNEKINDVNYIVDKEQIIQAGKRKFVKVVKGE